jgi:DNA-directed RNA polymerase subunit RPC12/RpoP
MSDPTQQKIRRVAQELAEAARHRVTQLEQTLLELAEKQVKIRADCDAARSSLQRLRNFEVYARGYYQCPRCWIDRNAQVALRPILSPNKDDLFQCRECGLEVVVSYR